MLLSAISVFLCILIFRELTDRRVWATGFHLFDIGYILVLIALTYACAQQPYRYWQLEHTMTGVARQLAEGKPATVHC